LAAGLTIGWPGLQEKACANCGTFSSVDGMRADV
jgi:hypothetical protein